ncbi:MAG TPA: sugar phosphate nucleotidyltransferase [Candidatus Methylomirabilis sp.]|nr:sugar phosphate nucleotidyltransferase [Candidatus Methylomirabilis sp.]
MNATAVNRAGRTLISPKPDPESEEPGRLWGLILAGGEGRRLQRLTRSLAGRGLPKQYCAVIGRRSMFQHTVDRAATCIPPDRIFAVITRNHLDLEQARQQLEEWPADLLVIQPYNRDTAPGILLPLLHIEARDPDATVVVFPSGHFIAEEGVFVAHVLQGVEFLEEHPDLLILLGMTPDRPETAYGWIEPGEEIARRPGYRLLQVREFQEEPNPAKAQRLYLQGGLWNSLVVLGRLRTFIGCIQKMLPDLWERFQVIRGALGTTREEIVVEEAYRKMPAVNISRHLLERIPGQLGVVPVKGVLWSDWGDERRIFETLGRIGKVGELMARLERQYHRREHVA